MKYRDLELSFSIEGTKFTILSICLEKLTVPIPKHNHSKNSYELHYISFGYGTLITPEKKFDIVPGSLFMTGPSIEHEQISVSDNPMTEYCIYLKVEPSGKQISPLMEQFLNTLFWFGADDNHIHELAKQIFLELENKGVGYKLVLQSLLQQVILQMVRNYRNSAPLSSLELKQNEKADLTYLTIEEAFLYDFQSITLEELSARISLSPRQTERLLQIHYNKTFKKKKQRHACMLLALCFVKVKNPSRKSLLSLATPPWSIFREHSRSTFLSHLLFSDYFLLQNSVLVIELTLVLMFTGLSYSSRNVIPTFSATPLEGRFVYF